MGAGLAGAWARPGRNATARAATSINTPSKVACAVSFMGSLQLSGADRSRRGRRAPDRTMPTITVRNVPDKVAGMSVADVRQGHDQGISGYRDPAARSPQRVNLSAQRPAAQPRAAQTILANQVEARSAARRRQRQVRL